MATMQEAINNVRNILDEIERNSDGEHVQFESIESVASLCYITKDSRIISIQMIGINEERNNGNNQR